MSEKESPLATEMRVFVSITPHLELISLRSIIIDSKIELSFEECIEMIVFKQDDYILL